MPVWTPIYAGEVAPRVEGKGDVQCSGNEDTVTVNALVERGSLTRTVPASLFGRVQENNFQENNFDPSSVPSSTATLLSCFVGRRSFKAIDFWAQAASQGQPRVDPQPPDYFVNGVSAR